MDRRKHTYIYTGNSPFLRQYVGLKNRDGWSGWSDHELDEIEDYLHGHWVLDEPIGGIHKVMMNPSVLKTDEGVKKENVKKTEKSFDIKNKLTTFVTSLKGFFITLFRKLLMEEDGQRYNRNES